MDCTNYWPYVYNPYQNPVQANMIFPTWQNQSIQSSVDCLQAAISANAYCNMTQNVIQYKRTEGEPKDIQDALYELAFPEDPIRNYFKPIIKQLEDEMAEIEKKYSKILKPSRIKLEKEIGLNLVKAWE